MSDTYSFLKCLEDACVMTCLLLATSLCNDMISERRHSYRKSELVSPKLDYLYLLWHTAEYCQVENDFQ